MNSVLAWFKGGFNKWRLSFLVFALIYAFFLLFNIAYTAIQWDEVTHFTGGVFLLRGDFQSYFNFNAFYPPMYDLFTAGLFGVAGISVFSGRVVAMIFSVLSLYAVFEFTYRTYGPKPALLASILLGIMPGYAWLSRMAMIETMLVFFFTVSLMLFFSWLKTSKNKFLILSGLMLGLGILTKYQIALAGVIMLTSLLLLGRGYLKQKLGKFPLLILTVVLVVVPWVIVSYQVYSSGMFNQWLYAAGIGNPEKSLYSTGLDRFPQWYDMLPGLLQTPLFYAIEITWPYSNVHPISLFMYTIGLGGLITLALRRKTEDKYLLIWFLIVYAFFTVIPNRQWRYILPLFPVLAIASASFLTSVLDKVQKIGQDKQLGIRKRRAIQIGGGLLIAFTLTAATFSVYDAYSWVAKDQLYIPIEAATVYASSRLGQDESLMVMCAQNLFSQDMVRFYMYANGKNNPIWQYPELPVDTYTTTSDATEFATELIGLCEQRNVKYVLMYEYGGTVPYFNTTLNLAEICIALDQTGKFDLSLPDEVSFGANPRRIFVVEFYR